MQPFAEAPPPASSSLDADTKIVSDTIRALQVSKDILVDPRTIEVSASLLCSLLTLVSAARSDGGLV